MPFYHVRILRCYNTPKNMTVRAERPQQALCLVASNLREEGVTDARSVEVVGEVSSLRG